MEHTLIETSLFIVDRSGRVVDNSTSCCVNSTASFKFIYWAIENRILL
ncbi:hypothetical protein PPL_09494 [Heterostelium album PN500]|uniref:Uncharacterized protein n=1 Tax=Heterostelium pallidum (strain ATCC 26659 / Pp 5 / PN500) TaxID=670386 RepID=D3BN83_HETP5|nr:hypothetical protein PPL_09494 [Heterostelium album PN500]EFA76743.1 hypothetical protein PPL_09494 [Heterostelium album PN500]|eukprot:XP_020428875.1 hypothetical protein PPL_09494 [Heterostelium album PN500]